jgi:hypothetical protein
MEVIQSLTPEQKRKIGVTIVTEAGRNFIVSSNGTPKYDDKIIITNNNLAKHLTIVDDDLMKRLEKEYEADIAQEKAIPEQSNKIDRRRTI